MVAINSKGCCCAAIILMAAVFIRAALFGGFLADVELSADRLAESFDGDQSRDRTDFHVKRFARR